MLRCTALILSTLVLCSVARAADAPVPVALQQTGDGFTLLRNAQPYFIQGAGGDASKQFLVDCGGNSFRTWGSENIDDKLDEAQRLGLTVTIGMWLGHEGPGFNYNNSDQVAAQFERAKAAVLKYRNHPAVLIWAIGNEMEGYAKGDNAAIWSSIESIAAMIHKLDPNHPTMTVIAEIGGKRIANINRLCPDIDIIGINSYGGVPSLAQRYRATGGVKPYIVTEFGPAGTWEVDKNSWGVPIELTSTAKADSYRAGYEKSILAEKGKLCLGSYVFAWGNKQEATATWYGLFLSDGTRLEPIDTMTELWSGKKPAHPCPQIHSLKVDGKDQVDPGDTVKVVLDAVDPQNSPLKVKWTLTKDLAKYDTGGETQEAPPSFPDAIVNSDQHSAEIHMPPGGGGYWLYAFVYNNTGGGAVADLPLHVSGEEIKPKPPIAKLPLILYEDGLKQMPYIFSGWMGKTDAIAMDEKCTVSPHTGATCMKCEFNSPDNFGGIIWQSPVNDWGSLPGGFNLTGATKLTFWARGDAGGEIVNFKLGVIGNDKPFPDSASAGLEKVELTKEWKQYTIDLAGKDLSQIKTGFAWVVGGQGHPIAFYLADIKYE
jgi:hypothetical protein